MVATAGIIAKLPSRNVATIAQAPHMSIMMLRVLFRNHRENELIVPMMRFNPKITNHATDLAGSPALLAGDFSTSHGQHNPVPIMSHITEETTPWFPFEIPLETEKPRLDSTPLEEDDLLID